jgi:hypothetical protein
LAAEADNEYAMIDSTIVHAHQHSAGAQKSTRRPSDRAKQRRAEHATVDALGNPTGIRLAAGQAHNLDGSDELLPTPADKAYDADEREIEPFRGAGKEPLIPSNRNRKGPRPMTRSFTRHGI